MIQAVSVLFWDLTISSNTSLEVEELFSEIKLFQLLNLIGTLYCSLSSLILITFLHLFDYNTAGSALRINSCDEITIHLASEWLIICS